MKLIAFSLFFVFPVFAYSQLDYFPIKIEPFENKEEIFRSFIAYKLPYRGKNYKFYGTLAYHVFGKAYADCKVQNTIVESFKISENNCPQVNFKILKGTRRSFGYLLPYIDRKSGLNVDFMTPVKKKNRPVKFYYRTGLFRFFIHFNSEGFSKINNNICIDFESLAQYIINLDDAANLYGLKIKRIVFNRHFLKKLYASSAGAELKKRDFYFAKYLNKKVNRKYDDLFHVDFEFK
ncbi:MAG: hypothetical protein L3J35_06675 [Bacteroidales bacterium]|nr:hypothetical protein [Bacteroidales bacterium]